MANTAQLSKFLKAEHCKDGNIINFMDAGIISNKTFKKDGIEETKLVLELAVEVNGEKKMYCPNQTTVGILTKAWGQDTERWVGKQGRVTIVPSPLGKDMLIIKPVEPADITI